MLNYKNKLFVRLSFTSYTYSSSGCISEFLLSWFDIIVLELLLSCHITSKFKIHIEGHLYSVIKYR